jgi:hypothetical protein
VVQVLTTPERLVSACEVLGSKGTKQGEFPGKNPGHKDRRHIFSPCFSV